MKKILLSFALAVGLLTSASTAMAQTVNMSSYITLTVNDGAHISLRFCAAAANTPVRIVSGSNTQDITVGTSWTGTATYTADGTTMTIYGDITDFICSDNGANLTALDPSHNTQLTELHCFNNTLTSLDVSGCTQLKELRCYSNLLTSLDVSQNTQLTWLDCGINTLSSLDVSRNTQLTWLFCLNNKLSSLDVSGCTQLEELWCYNNNFTTAALDDIYCALPDRTGKEYGEIYTLHDTSSVAEQAIVESTNAANATAKNWKVRYSPHNTDIATTGSYVCGTLNTDNYITLTVADSAEIRLNFRAALAGTPVKIVSGSRDTTFTVDKAWMTHYVKYKSDGTTMTVYGTITGFICDGNGTNLTALDPSHNTQLKRLGCSSNNLTSLDVSHNTQLEMLGCSNNRLSNLDVSNNTQLTELYCYDNKFTTAALDDIYCALPVRQASDNARIQPVYDSSSSNHATVLATNAQNATAKNWRVQYYRNNADIATTGTYVCGTPHIEPNMNSYITLTVTKDSAIRLDFAAVADGTPIRIVSGSNTQDITVGTDWKGTASYTAGSTTMTVYGDIIGFDCQRNGVNLTAIDVSHNTQLTVLNCHNNSLNSLDISQNTQLTELDCSDNPLGSLDVSHNTELKKLYCYNNQLSSLDVSNNTLLESIICYDNQLSSLDVSHNTQLKWLYCYGNNFTTQALDNIYCALPDRTDKDNGKIQPVFNSSDPNHATVLATNAANATAKNWKVQYYYDDTDIPTTGKHKCSATDIAEATAEQALTLYPNPVADVLYLSATARTIRVYNIYGIEVAHATDTDRVEVSHLPAGVYTVKADGTVAKMVKR